MSQIIAAINMTIDGFCDHTAGIADEELHDHYTALLGTASALLYGRTTYQLMEDFWPTLINQPSGEKAMDDFALAIDRVPKIVFSHTLQQLKWPTARLATKSLEEEVLILKQQAGKPVFVGSPSLIVALSHLHLIDEYQLCVHPVIIGKGLPLFKNISERSVFYLTDTKIFHSGAIVLTYQPAKNT